MQKVDEAAQDDDLDEEAERLKAEEIANKKASYLEHMETQIN
jgi:hypothetical protein